MDIKIASATGTTINIAPIAMLPEMIISMMKQKEIQDYHLKDRTEHVINFRKNFDIVDFYRNIETSSFLFLDKMIKTDQFKDKENSLALFLLVSKGVDANNYQKDLDVTDRIAEDHKIGEPKRKIKPNKDRPKLIPSFNADGEDVTVKSKFNPPKLKKSF